MDTKAKLDRLIKEQPKFHWVPSTNSATSWGIQRSFLERLPEMVSRDCVTLETGAGLSTVVFALIGTEHFCISPAEDEHRRIRSYCEDAGISTDRLHSIAAPSSASLPGLDLGGRELDFALIDGAHAFPQAMVDYFYINDRLKVNGLLAVDDLQIPSVGILHRFLMSDPAYELVTIDGRKTGVYRKIRATLYPMDFASQPMNKKNPDYSFLLGVRIRQIARQIPGTRWASARKRR